jgi:hypothetical protein
LFFDTFASLLDAIDQRLPLDQRVAYALAESLWHWRLREHVELGGVEIG